jgi:hypothetical protein
LKPFADNHVIGIKFELFAETSARARPSTSPPSKRKANKHLPANKKREKQTKKLKSRQEAKSKVIPFPTVTEEPRLADLKALAQNALRALGKSNSVAAYKILRKIVEA